MAESTPLSMSQEGLQHFFDSPELSDVKILLKIKVTDDRGRFRHTKDHTIFAHKIVLAAGSRVFRDYFKAHTQETNTADYTVAAKDICSVSNEVFVSVLRYLYNATPTSEDEDTDVLAAMDWHALCNVAKQFGIPSLRRPAVAKLQVYLEDLLEQGFAGDKDCVDDFVDEIQSIYRSGNYKDSPAIEVAAKLTCKNFAELRKYEDFIDLTDLYPEFLRAVLDHAAREAMLH